MHGEILGIYWAFKHRILKFWCKNLYEKFCVKSTKKGMKISA